MTSFLQTDIWASFKEQWGWRAHRAAGVLVLERNLPFGATLLYAPEVTDRPELLLDLLPEVKKIASRRRSVAFRLELLVDQSSELADRWRAALHYTRFIKAFEEVQPMDRQVIPLDSHQSVLAQMKQKGRYNIRVAERSRLVVRVATPDTLAADLAAYYELTAVTGKRDGFAIRPPGYYAALGELLYRHDAGCLVMAEFETQPVAGAIITYYDGVATYLYGASSDQHRNLMAPYGVHHAAITWAMKRGAVEYDLLAISPPGSKKHKWDGITRFKQQFGGRSVGYLGSYDFIFRPSAYAGFKFLEQLRRH